MPLTKAEKLDLARKNKEAAQAKEADRLEQERLDIEAVKDAIVEAVAEFKEALGVGVEFNNIDNLVEILTEVSSLREPVAELKAAISGLKIPEMPDSVEVQGLTGYIEAIKQITIKAPDVKVNVASNAKELQSLQRAFTSLTKAVKDNRISFGQTANDFMPVRRVIKDGNVFRFDDSLNQPGGGGMAISPGTMPVETIKMAYTELIDIVSATVTYIGQALPGSSQTDEVWRIKKILVAGSLTSITWADGVGTFTKAWSDRATLSYS